MQGKIWCAAVTMAILASVAHGQDCTNLSEGGAGNLQRAYDCIADLQTKLTETLEANRTLLRQQEVSQAETVQLANEIESINRLLSQAVIGFNRSERAGGACPPGWSLFDAAGGRFIVGAGNHSNSGVSEYPSYADDPDQATGGAEFVELKIEHMPAHTHRFLTPTLTRPRGAGQEHVSYSENARNTESTGGSQPHYNLPPYIALYFCKKN
ncbi:hypothetical protein ACFMPD_11595 [Sedimentitalea sp. HM32M-2]|uniref:hypothetical protein n=1 Tax=Sedimentitalea sp. HM32M-2 TaxID=3351566 RepID=UPI003645F096